ncbi:sulfotransferase domain-containing protein [Maricaulaceae bacterium EIL42A08]|nr:sulfotransferase domain-containing protein [Maricaulaceae bacterium EIL42A08]
METAPKIDFSVIGAQKSGTTALRYFLSLHPEIGVTDREPHYFDHGYKRDRPREFDTYYRFFGEERLSRKMTGDVTPIYLYMPGCLERMRAFNANMKIVVLLRDPADRAHSQWVMQIEKGEENRPFLHALLNERAHFLAHGPDRVVSYAQRGFYAAQLENLFQLFPRSQCLILRTEDLLKDHTATLKSVFKFLGVDETPSPFPEPKMVHSRAGRWRLSPIERALLKGLYTEDQKRLEQLIGWRF